MIFKLNDPIIAEFEEWYRNKDVVEDDLDKVKICDSVDEYAYFFTTTKIIFSQWRALNKAPRMVAHHKIKHVKQPTKGSCFAACVAMVLGIEASYVIADLAIKKIFEPYSEFTCFAYLVQHNVLPIKVDNMIRTGLLLDEVYMCTILSKTGMGLHSVLAVADSQSQTMCIYDPNENDVIVLEEMNLPFEPVAIELLRDCSELEIE